MPGAAHADRDVERDGHVDGAAHIAADQLLEQLPLTRGDLEDEFVMHLEEHPRLQAGFPQCGVDLDHRDLDQSAAEPWIGA